MATEPSRRLWRPGPVKREHLDVALRLVVLHAVVDRENLSLEALWRAYTRAELLPSAPSAALEEIAERYGDSAVKTGFLISVALRAGADPSTWDRERQLTAAAQHGIAAALDRMPDEAFLTAIESYCRTLTDHYSGLVLEHAERVLAGYGQPFRVVDGVIRWVGDRVVVADVLEPADAALDDPRLSSAGALFDAARKAMRLGGADAASTAVTELATATEALFDALMLADHVEAPARPGAEAKLTALIQRRPVLAPWRNLLMVPAQFRNTHGRAHPGGASISRGDVDTLFAVAAVAATLIHRQLPE